MLELVSAGLNLFLLLLIHDTLNVFSLVSAGTGVQWSTINQTVNAEANFTMLYTYLLLILDIFIYSVITWYFDALFPGDFGTPQPFYFPFTVR